jgi:glycosyltransferase involved in cell wall biosynthesis
MVKISGVIITYNEERNIARCIDSISKVVDEVVVVDSFSTDKTKEICLEKGVRFIEHQFETHISQKNFALDQAEFDIVLSLDADEYLSDQLKKSILEVKASWNHKAYKMDRLNSYNGKWIRHGSWRPDTKLRLWDRRTGRWGGENPHDLVVLDEGRVALKLKGDLMHISYRNSFDILNKVQRYSEIFSQQNNPKKSVGFFKIVTHTVAAFLKSYFLKLGFLDGYEGFAVAMCIANHTFYKYAKVKEKVN